jgi:hypothetical protein
VLKKAAIGRVGGREKNGTVRMVLRPRDREEEEREEERQTIAFML